MNQAVKLKLTGTLSECLVLKLHDIRGKSILIINIKS